jgi:plastocyanin
MRLTHCFVVAAALSGACGSKSSGTPNQITISNLTFSPQNLNATPGSTVTVQNNDSMGHSVTSTSTAGVYTPGAVAGISFDTGVFTGTATFSIPANATVGTVIPYFCTSHTTRMAQAQITITSASSGGG